MVDWCRAKVEEMRVQVAAAQCVYLEEVAKTTVETVDVADIESASAGVDKALHLLDSRFADWRKEAGLELKKLLG